MTNTIKLQNVTGVAAGHTAVLELPVGWTYHSILFEYSGVTLAQLGAIDVVINGDILDSYKNATQLQNVCNAYRGMKSTSGILELNFTRPNLLVKEAREVSAVGTGIADDPNKINTFEVRIDIDSGASAPKIKATGIVSSPQPSGLIRKTRHFSFDSQQSGDFEISSLPRGEDIDRIYFRGYDNGNSTVAINNIELKINNSLVYQRSAALNNHIQKNGVRTAVSGWFVFDPSELGYGKEALNTQGLNEMIFILNLASQCRVDAIVEYFGFVPSK